MTSIWLVRRTRAILRSAELGFFGVEVFFVISGYLIYEFGRIQAGYDLVDAASERRTYEQHIGELEDEISALKEQIALLVGMIKGPSYYDPRRNKQRCLQRRDVVLDVMRSQSIIGHDAYVQAKSTPIDLSGKVSHGFNRFPAFLDV